MHRQKRILCLLLCVLFAVVLPVLAAVHTHDAAPGHDTVHCAVCALLHVCGTTTAIAVLHSRTAVPQERRTAIWRGAAFGRQTLFSRKVKLTI